MDAAVKQAMQIHLSCGPGDILIFMTGQDDIEAVAFYLQEKTAQLEGVSRKSLRFATSLLFQ